MKVYILTRWWIDSDDRNAVRGDHYEAVHRNRQTVLGVFSTPTLAKVHAERVVKELVGSYTLLNWSGMTSNFWAPAPDTEPEFLTFDGYEILCKVVDQGTLA